ncbi:MAG: hypothetical protein JKY93_05070 [Gammaproteobacteria bacterium]|nr:hypothetical protein [Gammaproteobacteria bacterium]
METYIDGLIRMLIQLEVVTIKDNASAVFVFATGCAIVGIIAVFLDLAFYTLRGQSLLKLQHGKNTFIFLMAWAFGSFVMGYIGQLAKIFQVSLLASVLVGFTWPFMFTKFLTKLKEIEAEEEPEQVLGEEE